MKIILLTGIPGTGKTEIGNYLRDNHDFIHIDMEDQQSFPYEIRQYDKNHIDELMDVIKQKNKNIVITWGFIPEFDDKFIYQFQNNGAVMFWFDGDRIVAKKHWKNRAIPLDDWLFNYQVKRIDEYDIKGKFSPIQYNTFLENGIHKDKSEIVREIIKLSEDNK